MLLVKSQVTGIKLLNNDRLTDDLDTNRGQGESPSHKLSTNHFTDKLVWKYHKTTCLWNTMPRVESAGL